MRLALAEVTDWTQLAHGLTEATSEDAMRHRVRTLWLPGLTMLGCAAAMLLGICWLGSGAWWVSPDADAQVAVATTGVLLYVAFGAIGAAWSRRVGGTRQERLGAGLLPIALHMALVIPAIVVGALREAAHHPAHPLNPQLGVMLALIVVPGRALALGAAPFLRHERRAQKA